MSVLLVLNQSGASLRNVPLPPLVQSNGTSACTNESGRTFFFELGGVDYGSGGSLSVISAAAGLYTCNFSASKISVTGQGSVYYSSGTALPARTPIEVVRIDSMNSQDYGLAAFSTVTLAPGTHSSVTIQGVTRVNSGVTLNADTHSGATIQGLSNYANISNVTLAAGTHSGATIQGLSRINSSVTIANAVYSAVSLRLDAVDYSSAVTVGVGKIAPASYSGVTVGIDNIKGASYSDVTVQGLSNYANISKVTLNVGLHSGASVEIKTGGIQAVSFGANAVDAAALATDAGQEIADRILLRNIASGSDGGRDFRQALYAIRNRVLMSGSTGTVYQVDDATSAWTFSLATVAAVAINELKPGGV